MVIIEERFQHMRFPSLRYLSILDELRYLPTVSLSDRILHDSIKQSLESISKPYSNALLHIVCSLCRLSENELLTNYDLFEGSLYRILGKAAQPLTGSIKAKMLRYAKMNGSEITATDILDPSLTVSYVLKDIQDTQTLAFVRNIPSSEYIALLYTNEIAKNKILSEFFHPQTAEDHEASALGLISINAQKKIRSDLFNISYDELFNETVSIKQKKDWPFG